jgi:DNA-binding transcriptional LysR family regulator
MITDQLNLNRLRIFAVVYRHASMTSASKELHLTQSGVSQHIHALEEALGLTLFDRVKQRLVPTSAAATLYSTCKESLDRLEGTISGLKGLDQGITGMVGIGMPIEFGNNLVMPAIARFTRKHPEVRFRIRLGLASEMDERLLSGELDFAFIDSFNMNQRITTAAVYDEILSLCIPRTLIKLNGPPRHKREYYEKLDYVEYQEGEPILRLWFAHHLGGAHPALNVRASVMDVHGVARLIAHGAGAGVLPSYLLPKLGKDSRAIVQFEGSGKPLKNTISLAYLRERSFSPAARAALEWLRDALEKRL